MTEADVSSAVDFNVIPDFLRGPISFAEKRDIETSIGNMDGATRAVPYLLEAEDSMIKLKRPFKIFHHESDVSKRCHVWSDLLTGFRSPDNRRSAPV
jgi:hypothetical protein